MRAAWLLMVLSLITWGSYCRGLALPDSRLHSSEDSKSEDGHGGDKGDTGTPCKQDFVEQFFRLLSGPVGKEAEAVVAAALKLLQENDRVNLAALLRRPHPASSQAAGNFESSSGKARHLSLAQATKREMQFNPSGWRRKRDVSSLEELLGRGGDDVRRGSGDAGFGLGESRYFAVPESSVGGLDKRNWESDRRRELQLFQEGIKLKRKPLEFNPSGW